MHRLCDTKVGDLCTPFTIDQNVARRDVAMDNATHMCGCESTSNLRSNCRSAAWHQWPNAAQHGGKVLAINKFHHDGWRFTLWRNVEYGGNIWVRDDGGGATFGAEAISGGGRCCERCAEHLNGHVAAERLISCAEDERSRPFANQLLQPISACNDIARLQRSFVTL
jgi:hypothetical protein